MTPAARIQAVIELLGEVIETPRPADTLASLYFRARRYIGSKDRGAINLRFYRAMREYIRLCWWVEKAGMPLTARNLIIAELIFDREHTAESLPMMFSGERFAPDELTEEEYEFARSLEGKNLDDAEMPLRERCECPDWAYDALQRALGDRFEPELKAMLTAAPLDLRVNTIKANRADVLKRLQAEGYDAHEGKISPLSIRVFGRPSLSQHELYQNGYFEIQDEGSQMVALVAAAQPGEQVADFCAGAGGKTLAVHPRRVEPLVPLPRIVDGALQSALQPYRPGLTR